MLAAYNFFLSLLYIFFISVLSCCLDEVQQTRSRLVKQPSNETTDSNKPYQLFKHNLKHSHTEGLCFALLSEGLGSFAQSSWPSKTSLDFLPENFLNYLNECRCCCESDGEVLTTLWLSPFVIFEK